MTKHNVVTPGGDRITVDAPGKGTTARRVTVGAEYVGTVLPRRDGMALPWTGVLATDGRQLQARTMALLGVAMLRAVAPTTAAMYGWPTTTERTTP